MTARKGTFDWEFCKANCPYLQGCQSPRIVKSFMTSIVPGWTLIVYPMFVKFHALSNGIGHPDCIDFGSTEDDEFNKYNREIQKMGVRKFLKKRADMETMARQCPIYDMMMIHLFNKKN